MRGAVNIAALGLMLALIACGGGGGGGGGSSGGNQAPVFTSAATAAVGENSAGTTYTATATDANGDALTYSITGGADATRFSINATTGALAFATAPDFELAADTNADNTYLVTLSASDGALSALLNLSITVTNVPGVVAVRRVGVGFTQPLFLTAFGAGPQVLVVEKGGLVRILSPATGAIASTPFLNVSTEITTNSERGLLGLALAPDFATSGVFYVNLTNLAGDTEIRRYRTLTGDPNRADPASANVILTIDQPDVNHIGGWLDFGPDNMLYIAMGDGGGAGDPGGNGQNTNTLLGALLRIDPSTDAFPSDPNRDYSIPSGNPFASSGGAPEIWAYGLRNPFRNSFDRDTGHLYIADVGQDAREEINLARPSDVGANYGWNILEGTLPYAGGSTSGLTPPIIEYEHGAGALQGESVTGGYVYRGPITALRGNYFFGDFINRRIWSIPVASISQGLTITSAQFTDRTTAFAPNAGAIGNIPSFGEDVRRNLYIVDFDGEIFVVTEND